MLRVEEPRVAEFLEADFLASWEGRARADRVELDGLTLHALDGGSNEAVFDEILDLVAQARAGIFLECPYVTDPLTIAGQQVRLLVDTGSSGIVLYKSRLPAAVSDAPWRGDKTVQYASGAARLRRLELRQVGLGEHLFDKLEGWALDRLPHGHHPKSIDGVLGVLSPGCTRVRFDFERSELGCSR